MMKRELRILSLVSLAIMVLAGGVWMIGQARSAPQAAQAEKVAELQYPLFEPGEGPDPDPRRHLFFMTGHLAIYYGYEQGKLPASLEELRSYLFFLPVCHFSKWELSKDGNLLLIEAIVSETVEPKVYRKAINLPGSAEWLESKLAAIKVIVNIYRNKPNEFPPGVTEEDILSGRHSASPVDMMQSYARDDREFLQLHKSYILGHLLLPMIEGFREDHGVYPEKLEEAFAPWGVFNEQAWVSVMTGEPMRIGNKEDGTCIFYQRTDDGQGYELLVPLYGAGTEKPIGVDKYEFYEKSYSGGRFFRFTDKVGCSYGL